MMKIAKKFMDIYYSLQTDQFACNNDLQGRDFYLDEIKCQQTDPLDMLNSLVILKDVICVDPKSDSKLLSVYVDPSSKAECPVYIDPLSDSAYCHLTLRYYEYRGINVHEPRSIDDWC
jgi:hypothetical protein